MIKKIIAGAVVSTALFGVAIPAMAADASEVSVNIVNPESGKEALFLETVPSEYNFKSVVTRDGNYLLNASTIGENASDKFIKVHKNYTQNGVKEVQAYISNLKVNGEENNLATVQSFSINGIDVGIGTGNETTIYTDTDFSGDTNIVGNFTKEITAAQIGFTKAGLQPMDTLSGSITYTVTTTSTTP